MLREALEYLFGQARETLVAVEGREYSTIGLNAVNDPEVQSFKFNSLGGLVEYAKSDDAKNLAGDGKTIFAVVSSPTCVALVSEVFGVWKQRDTLAKAVALVPTIPFDKWQERQEFVINLQAMFVNDDHRAELQRFLSKVREGVTSDVEDNGIYQTATVSAGIQRVDTEPVPNPVTLRPFRTFHEVEQPASPFVFRMRTGFNVFLAEADGGAWRLEAKANIAAFLKETMPEYVTVLA